jgi:hypothetical protein
MPDLIGLCFPSIQVIHSLESQQQDCLSLTYSDPVASGCRCFSRRLPLVLATPKALLSDSVLAQSLLLTFGVLPLNSSWLPLGSLPRVPHPTLLVLATQNNRCLMWGGTDARSAQIDRSAGVV